MNLWVTLWCGVAEFQLWETVASPDVWRTRSQRSQRRRWSEWVRLKEAERCRRRGTQVERQSHGGRTEGRAREENTDRQTERERARCKHIHHMLQIISLCCCHNWLTDWMARWLTGFHTGSLCCLGDGMADWLTDLLLLSLDSWRLNCLYWLIHWQADWLAG